MIESESGQTEAEHKRVNLFKDGFIEMPSVQCCNLHTSVSSEAIITIILTSDTCLLRPPLVLKVLLQ